MRWLPGLTLFLTSLTACTGTNNLNVSGLTQTTTSNLTQTTTVSTSAKAVKIIFQQSTGGSFDAPSANGTAASPGSGLQAMRVFNTDGTLLASGGTSSAAWPSWLSSFEIGISGSNNTSAANPNCAHFASSTEASLLNCAITAGASAASSSCGASVGLYRISEADCSLGTPAIATGNGGPSDGVYFRAKFNRGSNYLGLTENILVTLEYSASGLNPAPANPTDCFIGGAFTPESCSDFVWKAYIKHTTSEVVQPFLLLVPPTFASILAPAKTGQQNAGTGVTAKQFIIPLASDTSLTTLQISRIQSNFTGSTSTPGTPAAHLKTYCTPGSLPGNSPLCAGMIFYSMSLYRI